MIRPHINAHSPEKRVSHIQTSTAHCQLHNKVSTLREVEHIQSNQNIASASSRVTHSHQGTGTVRKTRAVYQDDQGHRK